MKRTVLALILAAVPLVPACAAAPADPEAEAQAKLDRSRTGALLEEMDCSERRTRLLYDILAVSTAPLRNYRFRCAKGKETYSTPAWIDEIYGASSQTVLVDKDEVPAAKLWAEPLLALTDFAELVRKTEPKDGSFGLEQRFLAPGAGAVLLRYDKAVAQLRKAKLAGAFGGRGDAAFSALVRSLAAFDDLERTFGQGSQATFFEKASAVLKGGEEAFAALMSGEAGKAAPVLAFSAEYRVKPRLLQGQRAVALSLAWWQLESLKPGDLVDLLVTYDNTNAAGGKDTITATVLQGVKVLSAAKPAEAGGKGTLRLVASPLEAQYAALALVQAREIAVTQRAEGDADAKGLDVANMKKLVK